MAKRRTQKCSYHSRYNESYITAAQYITELICEKAAHQEHGDLPLQFWKLKRWVNYYKYQIKHAYKLLKQFPAQAIIDTLLHPRTKNVYSLANPILMQIIPDFIKTKDENINPKRSIPDSTTQQPMSKPRKNIVSKLKDLDDEV